MEKLLIHLFGQLLSTEEKSHPFHFITWEVFLQLSLFIISWVGCYVLLSFLIFQPNVILAYCLSSVFKNQWPEQQTRWVCEKVAQNVANSNFLSKLIHNWYRGKK
jgi:hypothetical protein